MTRWQLPSNKQISVISLTLAVLAILVSLITTYYSVFYVKEDLSVIFGDPVAIVTFDRNTAKANVRTYGAITFVNGGTLSIAVTGLELVLADNQPPSGSNCNDEKATTIRLKGAPFVVKPQDLQILPVTAQADTEQLEMKHFDPNGAKYKIITCLSVFLSSPRGAGLTRVPLFAFEFALKGREKNPNGSETAENIWPVHPLFKPIPLLR